MRSLTQWILTEPTRSPWDQFLVDFTRGFVMACVMLSVFVLAH